MKRSLPVLVAAATLVAGTGGLTAFWLCSEHDPRLRGLWSYSATVIGDPIALPVLAAALTSANGRALPWQSRSARLGMVAGAGLGATSQYLWLRDPDPDLNWTFPAPHTFTAAGWYHAAFVVGYAGFVGAHVGAIARDALQGAPLRREALVVAASASGLFAVLTVLDTWSLRQKAATRGTLLTLGIGVVASVGAAAAVRWVRRRRGAG